MPELIKPRPWAFDKGLTAPEWRWFWDEARAVYCFTTNKDSAQDLSGFGNNLVNYNSNLAIDASPWGPGWNFDDAAHRVLYIDDNDSLDVTGELTCYAVAVKRAASTSNSGLISKYTGDVIRPNQRSWQLATQEVAAEPLVVRLILSSDGTDVPVTLDATENITYGTPFVAVGVYRPSTSARLTVVDKFINNTVEDTTSIPSAIHSGTAPLQMAHQYNSPGAANGIAQWDGVILSAGFFARAWSDSEVQAFARDPFGPFRMADDVPEITTGAAPGGRIMSSLAASGGLAGMGGIAGQGGGLAG